ncbi:MAG: hypothetical protein ACHQQQ_10030 [Bacteroidota bacterium]
MNFDKSSFNPIFANLFVKGIATARSLTFPMQHALLPSIQYDDHNFTKTF